MGRKYTTKIDGKDVEVEFEDEEILKQFTQDELIEQIDTKDQSIIKKLFSNLGIKFKESSKVDEKSEENEGGKSKGDEVNTNNELKEILKPLVDKLENVETQMEEIKKKSKLTEQEQANKKLETLLDSAVTDGRIAKGERDKWKKTFEDEYDGRLDLFEKYVNTRPVDESLKNDNSNSSSTQNKGGNNNSESGGIPTFKTSEINSMSKEEYTKNRADIKKAYEADTIIVDT